MATRKKKFYAVAVGARPGIYTTWAEASAQVKGFAGARYKGFADEAAARAWLGAGGEYAPAQRKERPAAVRSTRPPGTVAVYTDGGCLGNPGPGGYGVVVVDDQGEREFSGGFARTTNNRMELTAAIVGLENVRLPEQPVILVSDSSYVINGLEKGWARGWRRRGWKKSNGDPVLNPDLWERLLALYEGMDVRCRWVRGHAGHPENERCDRLAVAAAHGRDLPPDPGFRG